MARALGEAVDLARLVAAVVVDRDPRAGPGLGLDELPQPGEGLDGERGLRLLVEVAERGEGAVGARLRAAGALDPETPEVDPAVGRALDVEVDLHRTRPDLDRARRLAHEGHAALQQAGPAHRRAEAGLGVAAVRDERQVALEQGVGVGPGERTDGARAQTAQRLDLEPVQRAPVDAHADVVVVQLGPAGRPPRAGRALPHHHRGQRPLAASCRLGHAHPAREGVVVALEDRFEAVAARDLGVVSAQQRCGEVAPHERPVGVGRDVGAHQAAPRRGAAEAGGLQEAVVVRELAQVALPGAQPQGRVAAASRVERGGLRERGPREPGHLPVPRLPVPRLRLRRRGHRRQHVVPHDERRVVGRPVGGVGAADEQVRRARTVPVDVRREHAADDHVGGVGQRAPGGGELHVRPVRGQQAEVDDAAAAAVDELLEHDLAVAPAGLGPQRERVVERPGLGRREHAAGVEAALRLDRAAARGAGVEQQRAGRRRGVRATRAGRRARAGGVGRGRGGLRVRGHRTARCRATTPPERLRHATSRHPAASRRPARCSWSGQARIDSAR